MHLACCHKRASTTWTSLLHNLASVDLVLATARRQRSVNTPYCGSRGSLLCFSAGRYGSSNFPSNSGREGRSLCTYAVLSIIYSLALARICFSFHPAIRPQQNSPYGPIKSPVSFAFSLLACRMAYLAAIPCMMTLLRKVAKTSPQSASGAGSQPATSAYHSKHFSRDGRPGV